MGSFPLRSFESGGVAVCASAGIVFSAGGSDSCEAQWALCDGSSWAGSLCLTDVS